jgi:hypothetical protein
MLEAEPVHLGVSTVRQTTAEKCPISNYRKHDNKRQWCYYGYGSSDLHVVLTLRSPSLRLF